MKRILDNSIFARVKDVPEGVVVVTPHRAAAARLGVSYVSLPRLAREVLRKCKGVTIAPELAARHTLKRVIAKTLSERDVSSVAFQVGEILTTVLRTGIDVEMLIENGSQQVRELGAIAKNYRAELARRKQIDNAELLIAASKCEPERRSLFIFGHHRARKEEILFIDAIAGDGSTFMLPCGDDGIFSTNKEWSEFLATSGWQRIGDPDDAPETVGETLAARFTGSKAKVKEVAATAYSNIEAEVRGVLSAAKRAASDGTGLHEIAIVSRDQDRYAPVIEAVAEEYGLPVQMGHSTRLSNTMFGGFVRVLFEAVSETFAYEPAARFLLHPFSPSLPEKTWTKARARHSHKREDWEGLGIDLSSLDWRLEQKQPLAAWAGDLRKVFDAFDVRTKAADRAKEILAFEKFREALGASVQLEGQKEIAFETFSAIVLEILSEERVPFAPGNGGVSLFEPNTIQGAAFDHLFVLGMAEGQFPAPARENAIIDFYERKQLAKFGIDFEEAAEVARWEDLSFCLTLLSAGKTANFSYSTALDGVELVQSLFFDRLGLQPLHSSAALTGAASLEEYRTLTLRAALGLMFDPVMGFARHQLAVELSREIGPNYDEYDGVIGAAIDPAARRWSASQLNAMGQCSFRWFAGRVLALVPIGEIEPLMDFTKRGSFYHRVMEIAVERAASAEDIRTEAIKHLEAAFVEAENDPEVGIPTLINWELQRSEHLKNLRNSILSYDFIRPDAKVVGIEKKFEGEWKGFPLVGYVDRIDDTPNGLIAIDYKTSSIPPKGAKDENGRAKIDVQIPLYSNVALRMLYPDGNFGSSVYYSLVKGKNLREEKDDDLQKLEWLVERLKAKLAAGDLSVDPDVDLDACKYCDFDHVCRKGRRLERKSANQ